MLTLTRQVTINPIPLILDIKKASWETPEEEVANRMRDLILLENMSKEELDHKLKQWYEIIGRGIEKATPTKTTQQPVTSTLLKYTQHHFQQLQIHSRTQGWSIQQYYQYKLLRLQ